MPTILPVFDVRAVLYGGSKLEDSLMEYKTALTSWFYYFKSTSEEREEILQCVERMARHGFCWILDSGAFSINGEIERGKIKTEMSTYFDEYIEFLKEHNNLFEEYYNLDVVGDFDNSWVNWEKMLSAGLKPVPVYHYPSIMKPKNWLQLNRLVRRANREKDNGLIGLGWIVGKNSVKVRKWLALITDRYPKQRFHALGVSAQSIIESVHFEYADSGTWTHYTASNYDVRLLLQNGKIENVKGGSLREKINHEFHEAAKPIIDELNITVEDLI